MRESKNWNLAVIAMKNRAEWRRRDGGIGGGPPSVYLEHFGSNVRIQTWFRKLREIKPLSIGWLIPVGSTLIQIVQLRRTAKETEKQEGNDKKDMKCEGGGYIDISGQWPANLLMQFLGLT